MPNTLQGLPVEKPRRSRIGSEVKELAKGLGKMSAGRGTYNWLTSIAAKQPQWFLGSLQGRNAYEAWQVHLFNGFRDANFLLKFEGTADPWERSRLVGERVRELRQSFAKLSPEQKLELGKQGESELRTGIELLSKDKRTILQLISVADPPVIE